MRAGGGNSGFAAKKKRPRAAASASGETLYFRRAAMASRSGAKASSRAPGSSGAAGSGAASQRRACSRASCWVRAGKIPSRPAEPLHPHPVDLVAAVIQGDAGDSHQRAEDHAVQPVGDHQLRPAQLEKFFSSTAAARSAGRMGWVLHHVGREKFPAAFPGPGPASRGPRPAGEVFSISVRKQQHRPPSGRGREGTRRSDSTRSGTSRHRVKLPPSRCCRAKS